MKAATVMLDRERKIRFDAYALSELERVSGKDVLQTIREIQGILKDGQSKVAEKAKAGEEITEEDLNAVGLPFRMLFCLTFAGVSRTLEAGTTLQAFSDLLEEAPGVNPIERITKAMPTILAAFFGSMVEPKNDEAPEEARGKKAEEVGTGKTSNEQATNSDSIQKVSTD